MFFANDTSTRSTEKHADYAVLVGIGFIALLTGAVAARFLATDVREAEDEVTEEVEVIGSELLVELRAIRARLEAVEAALARHRA